MTTNYKPEYAVAHTERMVHIIYIPFRGVGIMDDFRDDDWFTERVRLFVQYTLQSLKNQSSKNFVVWLSFRPQDSNNFLTHYLGAALKQAGIPYVQTFDGLMYWDDKFTLGAWPLLMNAARVVRGCLRTGGWGKLIPMLRGLFHNKNTTLVSRLTKSLETVKKVGECDWVLLTRLDSDDMLHRDAVKEIQQREPKFGAAYCYRNGYALNTQTGDLARYEPKTNPPFHTIAFPADVFFDAERHERYYGPFRSHEDIPKNFFAFYLPDGRYCVGVHSEGDHISNTWKHPYRKEIIPVPEAAMILREFGQ